MPAPNILGSGKTRACAFDVLIAGAGPAGLTCAYEAASRGLHVLLLDGGDKPARKLAISGGGKANFSNLSVTPADYLCRSDPDFCKVALNAMPPNEILRRMQKWKLPVEEREQGRLFLSVPAMRLVAELEKACAAHGCQLVRQSKVQAVRRENDGFAVDCGKSIWRARSVVLALGSPASPKAGGSHAGWRIAAALGHSVAPARAALTPFKLSGDTKLESSLLAISGISLPARLTLPEAVDGTRRSFTDYLLFTHTGLSGPLILSASLFWRNGQTIELDLLPDLSLEAMLDANEKRSPRTLLREHLPQRLIDAVLPAELAQRKTAELSRQARRQINTSVHALKITPAGLEGFDKAEVCSGGVDTAEIDPARMESRLVPNLHIIGELLDVTGRLGGYNLHWAWASGSMAGRALLSGD